MRRIDIPELRIRDRNAVKADLAYPLAPVSPYVVACRVYPYAVGIDNINLGCNRVALEIIGDLGIHDHRCLVRRNFGREDLQRMAGEILFRVGDDKVYIAVNARARVPAGIIRIACVGAHR